MDSRECLIKLIFCLVCLCLLQAVGGVLLLLTCAKSWTFKQSIYLYNMVYFIRRIYQMMALLLEMIHSAWLIEEADQVPKACWQRNPINEGSPILLPEHLVSTLLLLHVEFSCCNTWLAYSHTTSSVNLTLLNLILVNAVINCALMFV